ncbi:APH(3'') family aminoglycoside O-phosphotransferase [Chitiniphilus purpureus]|uniref:Aminoglycoside 3'-phosphotransferase n=1 Tax=Chitiniphilus purpureus TaxID=2981137 RepID=A0ABY6DSF2_9NEIS|nr:APH(3'') family aminoglycoside O-phosphotransferase [Chitiniphilus sp. CD1]UXY17304.1 APH(3'') family aminoglycoside O-phosphotransferase [Chitiniphilus sp. CD1]
MQHFSILGEHRDWRPVGAGESGDHVYRRGDGLAYAKLASGGRAGALAGERDRLQWLAATGFACPRVLDWQETGDGACLVMSAVAGVPASMLTGPDLLQAWPDMLRQLALLHAMPAAHCPFERGLAGLYARAEDVVARNAVNPDFLPDEDRHLPAARLLERITAELPLRLRQEQEDRVLCHGDACMPNFMIDPQTFHCTGLIDLGRLGTADRYADLALMLANASDSWTSPRQAAHAFALLFDILAIQAPDRERLAFYLRLDPLTWG